MSFSAILKVVNDFVWGPYMLALLVGTGVFLTIRLRFLPWRNLGFALKSIFKDPDKEKGRDSEGDITPFQSLMTALAATIGTGNIVGVATAMVLGGPGAIVWMWISALFGLSTNSAERRFPFLLGCSIPFCFKIYFSTSFCLFLVIIHIR